MDTKWLEDFISLAETNNFSRSAALRHVTQPAFSRRIQTLETWLGTDLIDRTSYPTRVTPAGRIFHAQALEMLAQINGARELLRSQRAAAKTSIDLAVPHALSLTFVPKWLAALERDFSPVSRLMALNVHDAVMQQVEGGCDLLLCYHHTRQPVQIDPGRYEMLTLSRDRFVPTPAAIRQECRNWRYPAVRQSYCDFCRIPPTLIWAAWWISFWPTPNSGWRLRAPVA